MYTYQYPRPAVTVDCAIFAKCNQQIFVLLIQRANDPYQNKWAFPGGFVDMDEDLDTAAYRELKEETGFQNVKLEQFRTYGGVNRDPRGRTISVVYAAIMEVEILPEVVGQDDALKAEWKELTRLPELAFDHELIMNELRNKLQLH